MGEGWDEGTSLTANDTSEPSPQPSPTFDGRGSIRTSLQSLGWTDHFQSAFDARAKTQEIPGRVIEEQRGAYVVQSEHGEWLAGISGRLRHRALRRDDFPAVGDWVAIKTNAQEKTATLQHIFPRHTSINSRAKRPGRNPMSS